MYVRTFHVVYSFCIAHITTDMISLLLSVDRSREFFARVFLRAFLAFVCFSVWRWGRAAAALSLRLVAHNFRYDKIYIYLPH